MESIDMQRIDDMLVYLNSVKAEGEQLAAVLGALVGKQWTRHHDSKLPPHVHATFREGYCSGAYLEFDYWAINGEVSGGFVDAWSDNSRSFSLASVHRGVDTWRTVTQVDVDAVAKTVARISAYISELEEERAKGFAPLMERVAAFEKAKEAYNAAVDAFTYVDEQLMKFDDVRMSYGRISPRSS